MPKGEAQYIEYNPGEKPTSSTPTEEGNYELKLMSKGKPGPKGWRKKNPKKYPNRACQFAVMGTEDEVTGSEKRVTEFVSLSPGFPLQRIANLAYASGYPEKLKLMKGPKGKVNDPSVMQNMKATDALLDWIEENDVTLRAFLKIEAYNGEDQNKVGRWLPPDAVVEERSEENEDENEESEESNDDESEDESSEESDSDDADEEAEEAEEAESDSAEDEGDSDEESNEEGSEEAEPEEEFEAVPRPLKPKVKQGPVKKGGKLTPKMKPAKKHKR
jgi:hypothetical protein